MKKLSSSQIISGIVGVIGLYMVFNHADLNPPTLSGAAFILIAVALWRK